MVSTAQNTRPGEPGQGATTSSLYAYLFPGTGTCKLHSANDLRRCGSHKALPAGGQ